MENASKALIIAGSILLAIAIIGIGMAVLRTTQDIDPGTKMDRWEVDAFNSEFTRYGGTQDGSNVRVLLDAIKSNNNQNSDEADKAKQIVVKNEQELTEIEVDGGTDGTTASDISSIKNSIVSGNRYKVTFNYTKSGLIKEIGIKKI